MQKLEQSGTTIRLAKQHASSHNGGNEIRANRRTVEEVLDELGGVLGDGERDESSEGPARIRIYRSEEEALQTWASKTGRLDVPLPPPSPEDGGEHRVMLHAESGRVLKATHPGTYGAVLGTVLDLGDDGYQEQPALLNATPREYLNRLLLSHEIFGDDIRVEGVGRTAAGLSIVTSQDLKPHAVATPDEISTGMKHLGFDRIHAQGIWQRKDVLVWDLVGNVAKDASGLHVFDALIMRAHSRLIALLKRDGKHSRSTGLRR